MNPTLWHNQSLLTNSVTNESDLNILLDSCEEYMINYKDACPSVNAPSMDVC